MKATYLIDTIGTETGMHLYDEAFVKTYSELGEKVIVLSNYKSSFSRMAFPNFYRGSKVQKMISFFISCISILFFRTLNRGNYVYQAFGLRTIDRIFILLLPPSTTVIVHDLYEITGELEDPQKGIKNIFYKTRIKKIICHSIDVQSSLRDIGYDGELEYMPHFSYVFDKTIDESRLDTEVLSCIDPEKFNFLFFGQLRKSKGILTLLESLSIIEAKCPIFKCKCNVIVAGMDKDKLLEGKVLPSFATVILRYINDNELNFLFSHCQVVLLPYEEICQSGVLEVASYFNCPSIVSDLPYFQKALKSDPSLGTIFSPNTPEALVDAMLKVSGIHKD